MDSRHQGCLPAFLLDLVSSALTLPFYYAANYGLASFYQTTRERREVAIFTKIWYILLVGPLLILLSLLLLPFALPGWLLWIFLNTFLPSPRPFSIVSFGERKRKKMPQTQTNFTFASMNVLLGSELVNKFNNLDSTFTRLRKICKAILEQSQEILNNLGNEENILDKEQAVLSRFPNVDFICFQELFDRAQGAAMARNLSSQYPYFVLDVAEHNLSSNFCMLSSGLGIASRFPIVDAKFVPFKCKRGWQWCIGYGVLVCKVDLGQGRVGVVANLHNVAYQGKEQLIAEALSQVEDLMGDFRKQVVKPNETLIWEVIGGDFNCDNLSPGDQVCAEHSIFQNFKDMAMVKPGEDAVWAVGTELRQRTLYTREMRDAATFKEILVDDARRRHYVLDADVEEQTFDLMTSEPSANNDGEVVAEVWGGMRRIDKLLFRCQHC